MNQIVTKQNELSQLQRLSAQRELYSSAKTLFSIQLFFNIFISIILSFISLYNDKFSPYAAAIGLAIILLDTLFLERIIKSRKEKAAKIQEMFDCDVLNLPKSPLKSVDDVAIEEILTYYHAHTKISSNIEKIKDWYPGSVNLVPLYVARIICQRANCWWDASLRKKYLASISILGVIVVTAIFVIGIIKNLPFLQVILIASALMPMFQFVIKQYFDNYDSIIRLKELIHFAEAIWQDTISGKGEMEIIENSRRLQDEIYTHRSQNPLILDSIYKVFRNSDEQLLNKSAEHLIEEYNSRRVL
ncbi:MAG: S-4TM family putative pore-forming effector [Bacteroidia bacterium]